MRNNLAIIILAGGYATRLGVKNKALINVGGMTALEYVLMLLPKGKKYLSTNEKWKDEVIKNFGNSLEIIVEPHETNEKKLGAVGGIVYAINKIGKDYNYLVYAVDNILIPLESAKKFLEAMILLGEEYKKIVVGLFREDREIIKGRYGNVLFQKIGDHYGFEFGRITLFVEKPKEPISEYASMAILYIPTNLIKEVEEVYGEGIRDKLGSLLEVLVGKDVVLGIVFDGEFYDIGTEEILKKVRERFLIAHLERLTKVMIR